MNATMEPQCLTQDLGQLAGKYLTFRLGTESYGITVVRVREIIRLAAVTAVPQMPAHVKGVINLRGRIVPVLDLGQRLGLGEAESSEQTCIVVVEVATAQGTGRHMGLIVDGVEEVIQIAAAELGQTPDFGTQVGTECLLGMAKVKGAVKTLLDIDRVVCGDTTGHWA